MSKMFVVDLTDIIAIDNDILTVCLRFDIFQVHPLVDPDQLVDQTFRTIKQGIT